ncbi:DUF3304 domain-containing protein, partial [Xanthomonas oryzae]|uniref:DUF3304 domain-containing protein n=1 Tax=Xanthomonas oryzae TaxID=347 RepID=UPI002115D961
MKIARCVLYGLLLMWISACHGGNTVSTTLVGYNHTDKDVGHFTVDGNEGGFLQAHRGGGTFVFWISVPVSYTHMALPTKRVVVYFVGVQ